jgi:hypothetical protein
VSQQPDMTAPRWQQAPGGTPYQVDTEPHQVEQDWNAPRAPQQAPWGAQQAQGGPGYPAEDPAGAVPTEFDHLFRDSAPDSRRAIDRTRPAVGNASGNFLEAPGQQQPYEAAPPQQPEYQQAEYQQPQYPPEYPQNEYQQQEYQQAEYPQAEYQQYGGFNGEQTATGSPQVYQGQVIQPTAPYGYPQGQPQYAQPGEWNQGGGPGGPGGPGFGGGGARSRRPLIVGGAVAAVVVVVGLVYGLSGGGGGGKPNPTAATSSATAQAQTGREQADQILALIQESGPLRQDASGAVVDLLGCQSLTSVQSTLTMTTSTRNAQASKVSNLDVSKIGGGAELVQELNTAWTASAASDNAYKQIATDLQSGGCSGAAVKSDPNYTTAQQQGVAATVAKEKAARLWNADATALGEKTITSAML